VVLETDEPGLAGYGFTFTIGRGNDLCVLAARHRVGPLVGRDVDDVVGDLGGVYRELAADSQLRWLGPDKGVVHLAMAAVMNAAGTSRPGGRASRCGACWSTWNPRRSWTRSTSAT
jgi:L-fuconate dehydratase